MGIITVTRKKKNGLPKLNELRRAVFMAFSLEITPLMDSVINDTI
jgi:hypothetical protein